MIQFTEITSPVWVTKENDCHIPMSVKFHMLGTELNRYDTDPLIYWYIGDGIHHFLEITLNRKSKVFIDVTLLMASNVYFFTKKEIPGDVEKIIGFPFFDTSKWEPTPPPIDGSKGFLYIDDDRDKAFDVYVEETSLIIVLTQNSVTKIIQNGCIIFGFDKDQFLCLIKIEEISPIDLDILRDNLRDQLTYKNLKPLDE